MGGWLESSGSKVGKRVQLFLFAGKIPLARRRPTLASMTSHPCLAGAPCSCHRAGPSTLPRTTASTHRAATTANRTAPALLLAALVAPAFAAPAPLPPSDLPFLYPSLARRVTDTEQAPDDPSTFTPEPIRVEDLVRAGLPLKFVFDPSANLVPDAGPDAPTVDVEVPGSSGAWIVDDYWELHGKRFGPVSALADSSDPLISSLF